MSEHKKNIVIIGGGPGGYPAAIKAAQLGASVTLVDRNGLGGTCLHRGCIPTKFLLKAAKENDTILKFFKKIDMPFPPVDVKTLMRQKAEVVGKLASGTAMLLNKNGVRVISGTAGFADSKTIRVAETGETIGFSSAVIATGSESAALAVEGMELEGVYDSSGILDIDHIPRNLAVIGGGYIGLEFAQIFQMFGAKVTVIEMMPHIMPGTDPEISTAMQKILNSHGIKIHTNARLKRIQRNGSELSVRYEAGQKEETLSVDAVLVAVGRKPRIDGLNLDKIGVRMDAKGAIAVSQFLETSVSGIYAVGDVAGGLMLAHKATAEGECAAVNIIEGPHEMSYAAVPSVMYTYPEMAAVGLTEEQAKEKYGEILVGRFPMAANGRAVLSGAQQGFVKVIAEMETEIIVGASFVCPEAGHLIGEATMAIQMEATLDEVAETIHAHPTLSEAFREAALDAKGEAIHIPPC
ncbi:MAG: dihydrolipoyl dehydrogenase [Desulfobacterales bacterium]|jgi:dihydrolipoamide dehydrogenase|nr:dihydrolipoyl dehydrogenase [Desulfobacterales bacterium]